jgi:hypothetical protein
MVAVQRVLNRYRDAFSVLDAAAVKTVWPAANEASLRQRFTAVDEQNLEFHACRISVNGTRSTAWCRGSLQLTLPQRRSRLERREWLFTLQKSRDNGWRIETVSPE